MPEIDRLEIAVQTQAQKANAELDKLVGKLDRMSTSLSRINASGLKGLANGVQSLSNSMQSMSSVKTTDFSRLAKNIEKLGNIDQSKINATASAIRTIANSLTASTGLTAGATQITDLANSISRLGYKSASNAITNIPLMAKALQDLMRTLSTSPQVSRNLIDMTNAISNLASQGSKVGSATNNIGRSLNGYSSHVKSATATTKAFTFSIAGLLAKIYAIKRAVTGLWGSVEKSMDFTETINLFQTSFKKIGIDTAEDLGLEMGSAASEQFGKAFIDRATNFNRRITDALSLDPNLMMNYQAVFAQMSNSMNLTAESAINISESFTLLGNDIASLWNIDTDKSMKKLQSGLAGQIRPLRELGIDISKTSLEMYALKYGIEGSVEKMSQAAKVQLRWLAIMEQTEVAYGDMSKTLGSSANQFRILQQQWTNLSRSIGNVFLPVVTTVLPYINAVVIALRRMIDTFATAVGFELPDYSDTNIYKDITTDIEGIGGEAEDATEFVDGLKKSLAGFDELNILSEGSGKKGLNLDLGGGYGELDDAIQQKTNSYMAKFNEELFKMSNKADGLADGITEFFNIVGQKIEPTTKAFKNLWDNGLSKLGSFIGSNWISFYKDFMVPVGSWILGEGLPDLLDIADGLLNDVDLKSLSNSMGNLYKALAPFAITAGKGLIFFFEAMAEILTPAISTTVDLISKALNGIASAIKKIPEDTTIAIGGAIGGLVTAILLFSAASAIAGIVKNIGAAIGILLTTITAHPVLAIAAGVITLAGAFLALDKAKFERTELGQYIIKLDELTESAKKVNEEIDVMLSNQVENRENIEAEYAAVQTLADKYFDLADKASLTNDEQFLMKTYAGELIEKIPELNGLINEQTGAYKGTKAEIQELIKKTKEYYLVQAAQESLIEIAKAQYEAEKSLKGLIEEKGSAIDDLTELEAEYTKQNDLAHTSTRAMTAEQKNAALKAIELSGQITRLKDEIGEIDTQIDETTGTQKDLNKEWDYAVDYIKTYSETTKKEMPKVESAVDSALSGIDTKARQFKLPKLTIDVGYNISEFPDLSYKAAQNEKFSIKQYATGGFPNTGEAFIARENGIPEMVGRIGNRTAVANNDQITDGIASAVEGALINVLVPVMQSMGGGSNSDIIVENSLVIDSEKLYNITQKGKQKSDRRHQTVTVLS